MRSDPPYPPFPMARLRRAATVAAGVNAVGMVAVAAFVLPAFPLAPGAAGAAAWAESHRHAITAGLAISAAGVAAWLPFLTLLGRALEARGEVVLAAVAGAGVVPDLAAHAWAALSPDLALERARVVELVSSGWATACYAVVALALAAATLGSARTPRGPLLAGFGLLAALPALVVAALSVFGDGGLAFFGPTSVRPLFVAWATAVAWAARG